MGRGLVADISIPQGRDYFRIEFSTKAHGTLVRNNLDSMDDVKTELELLRERWAGFELLAVQRVIVEVKVVTYREDEL